MQLLVQSNKQMHLSLLHDWTRKKPERLRVLVALLEEAEPPLCFFAALLLKLAREDLPSV